MPGPNGIEFLEAVRTDNPDLPFILFTGKGSEEVASDAISAGVTDYRTILIADSTYWKLHYDKRTKREKMEQRREFLDSM